MIYVRDKGRLCNNILQYGHLYAWGREHRRETMSMRFAYKYRYFHICHTAHHNFFRYLYAKYAAKWGLLPVVSFDDEGVDYSCEEQQMLSCRNLVAQGWYARWYDLRPMCAWVCISGVATIAPGTADVTISLTNNTLR